MSWRPLHKCSMVHPKVGYGGKEYKNCLSNSLLGAPFLSEASHLCCFRDGYEVEIGALSRLDKLESCLRHKVPICPCFGGDQGREGRPLRHPGNSKDAQRKLQVPKVHPQNGLGSPRHALGAPRGVRGTLHSTVIHGEAAARVRIQIHPQASLGKYKII